MNCQFPSTRNNHLRRGSSCLQVGTSLSCLTVLSERQHCWCLSSDDRDDESTYCQSAKGTKLYEMWRTRPHGSIVPSWCLLCKQRGGRSDLKALCLTLTIFDIVIIIHSLWNSDKRNWRTLFDLFYLRVLKSMSFSFLWLSLKTFNS